MPKPPPFDLHLDTVLRWYIGGKDVLEDSRNQPSTPFTNQTDLVRLREADFMGGVLGIHFFGSIIWPRSFLDSAMRQLMLRGIGWVPKYESETGWRMMDRQIEEVRRWRRDDSRVVLANNPEDLEIERGPEGLVFGLGVEGAHMLNKKIERVVELRRRGVTYLTLVHTLNNHFAHAPTGFSRRREEKDLTHGLTKAGRDLVEELYRVGIVVDVAHCTTKGVQDALEVANGRPLLCSHAGLASVHQPKELRNLRDDHAVEIARHGGVVGVFLARDFLGERADGSRFADHFVSLLNLLDERRLAKIEDPWDHVGIGTDYDGYIRLPMGQKDVLDFWQNIAAVVAHPNLPDHLKPTEERWKKCFSGNFIRLWRRVRSGAASEFR